MKNIEIYSRICFKYAGLSVLMFLILNGNMLNAQTDSSSTMQEAANATHTKKKPIDNTFESNWIIDNQTVMVSIKGTLEFDIQHRFGIVNNGFEDFYGMFSPAIIRLGFEYVPINNLQLGFGLCSNNLQFDFNAKYALLKQIKGGIPISITYYGNAVVDARDKSNFVTDGDRLSYFNQLIFARKITSKFSIQSAISLSHFNNVPGYITPDGIIMNTVENDQFTWSIMGRYKFSKQMAVLFNYDQPLTQNLTTNPNPNLAVGIEITTSSHCFQIILANYQFILPQNNALFNQNDYTKGQFLLGFNMTKLWNF